MKPELKAALQAAFYVVLLIGLFILINLVPSWVITVVVLPLLVGGLWWVIYAALKGPGNKTT
jgi:hypothetical protein